MITIGSKVIWKDPYWSDLSIEGKVVEDLGNKVVIEDQDSEDFDDRLEFHKSELTEVE
jgi:hypothetical protein|tara:strand:+ start:51 stop:224 length:174 start_codon:yes stop_codon:yes gene_type:complete